MKICNLYVQLFLSTRTFSYECERQRRCVYSIFAKEIFAEEILAIHHPPLKMMHLRKKFC